MRKAFDTSAEALGAVHAWAETERQLEAAIGLLRTSQARCTLAVSCVGAKFSAANAATDGQIPNATKAKSSI